MAKNTTNDVFDFDIDKLREELEGKSSIVLTDENGVEYTAKYDRALVKKMEKEGITVEEASKLLSKGTYTAVEEFLEKFALPAFNNSGTKVSLDEVVDLMGAVDNPGEVIGALMVLFMTPTMTLLTKKNPTQTRAKFRFV